MPTCWNVKPTSWQVLTGCHPFNDTAKYVTVMLKVMKGDRPERPPLGFSDALWESLVTTWVVEDGPGSNRRPSASVVLDWLKKDVDNWEKSIVPIIPKQWEESGGDPKHPSESHGLLTTLP